MIKLDIDNTNGEFNLEHNHFCCQHFIDEITKAIDMVIIDDEIKTTRYRDLPIEEKKRILLVKRKHYLEMMQKEECECMEYLSSPEVSITDFP